MKHFQDKDYDLDDWEGSMVFRHWLEDSDNDNNDNDDYDGSLVFAHWNGD